jgi:hypothetical protein
MTQKQYLQAFKKLQQKKLALTQKKNSDYADKEDAYLNFRLIETLSNKRISVEHGLLVRLSDKLQRVANLIDRDAQVKDEQIEDTLEDLAIYADILNIYIKNK